MQTECLSPDHLHESFHVSFFVSLAWVAQPHLKAIEDRQACGDGGQFPLRPNEFFHDRTHVVVHNLNRYPGQLPKECDVGILETNGLLRMIEIGEAVIAVGHCKDRQLVSSQPSSDFQFHFFPVEFTNDPGLMGGPYERFFSGLFLFPNVVPQRCITDVNPFL